DLLEDGEVELALAGAEPPALSLDVRRLGRRRDDHPAAAEVREDAVQRLAAVAAGPVDRDPERELRPLRDLLGDVQLVGPRLHDVRDLAREPAEQPPRLVGRRRAVEGRLDGLVREVAARPERLQEAPGLLGVALAEVREQRFAERRRRLRRAWSTAALGGLRA